MRKRSERQFFDATDTLADAQGFFLVGIGGAGMSGLARMLAHRGYKVRGTDSTDSPLIRSLMELGIDVHIGHSGDAIQPGDAVVLTDAIDLNESTEVFRAKELGCRIYRRSQALAWTLRDRKTIAVTGTHGKTTTTAMIASGLRAAGMDPLIVVGAEVPEFGSSVVEGKGEWAVVEACEAYESYLDLDPHISVLTNLELDHIDYHETFENLLQSMRSFLNRTDESGHIIVAEDNGAGQALVGLGRDAIRYGESTFADATPGVELTVKGRHLAMNAGGALEACRAAGADVGRAASGIAAFRGAERRLQTLQEGEITVIDDYAHHPTEVRASLQAIRENFPHRRLVVVFQPHLYSRTQALIPEFAEALSQADLIVLTDIYPAREKPIPGVSSLRIAELATSPCHYVPSRHLLPRKTASWVQSGDVVVGMGAGNISEFGPEFIKEMARSKRPRVVVFTGGESPEREVSLNSGLGVKQALDELGYDSFLMDATEALLGKGSLEKLKGPDRPGAALLPIHGVGAEDGAIQGLLQLLHIPYSGSGIQASALALDKDRTKEILSRVGLETPKGVCLRGPGPIPVDAPLPAVVKPNDQGSTVGLFFVKDRQELEQAVEACFRYSREVLIEELIEGVEISTPVMGDRALLPVEIRPNSGVYDFAAKYTPGATDEPCPPVSLSHEQIDEAMRLALLTHQALGCRGLTRTDMIVQPHRHVIIEINTNPGMTPTSLAPRSVATLGMTYNDLVEWMVKDAQASIDRT